jgi:hypothetical protein
MDAMFLKLGRLGCRTAQSPHVREPPWAGSDASIFDVRGAFATFRTGEDGADL